MGSSTIPAAGGSSSSAAPLFAGSLVTSGYSSVGYYQTSLAAGSYVIVQNNGQNEPYGYKAPSNPSATGYKIPNNNASYFTLTTAESAYTAISNIGVYGLTNIAGFGSNFAPYTQGSVSYANGTYFLGFGTNNLAYLYYSTDALNYSQQFGTNTVFGSTSGYVSQVSYQSGYYSALMANVNQTSYALCWFTTVGGAVTFSNTYYTAPAQSGWTEAYYIGGSNSYFVSWSGSTTGSSNVWSAPAASPATGANRFTMTTNCQVNAVGYGMGSYVAGAQNGTIASSTDAITWATRTSGISHSTNGNSCYAGFTATPSYVFAWTFGRNYGSNYDYAYSTNGVTWSVANWPTLGAAEIASGNVLVAPPIYCTNGIGIHIYDTAISDQSYFVSTNGISWQTRLRNSVDSSQVWASTNNQPQTIVSCYFQGSSYLDVLGWAQSINNSNAYPDGNYLFRGTSSYYSIYNTTSSTLN